jgi:putative Mg2+ transporter-C (MgtC) family protein
MEQEYTMACHLLGALGAGALIGLEREFHGRPAGFRTHTLVCVTSSLLMLVTLYQSEWLPGVPLETIKWIRPGWRKAL